MGTSIWWGVQTITSLGYGTVEPTTVGGKLLSGLVALMGLVAFAIPAGIVSSRFALIASEERERHSLNMRSSMNFSASLEPEDLRAGSI